ncbi:hypothetical protein [Arcobacter vandammei]|uniref:hypothetical protein n=1 Tax=Arcobacter vandammei TaxID=2782243 RepID=UPI0018DF2022|nr:hypothetical protein [Arcobacter vandammei]
MRSIKYILVSTLGIFIFSGCSSKYPITYNTNPTGATVMCNNVNKGYSPVTLYYELDDDSKKYKSMRTVPCTAYWVSGVEKDFSNIWDLDEFPSGVMETLERGRGEGYDRDVQFSLQVQQMKAQQAQAEALQRQANSQSLQQGLQNFNNSLNQMNQQSNQIYNNSMQQMNDANRNFNNSNQKKYYYMHQMAPNLYYVK